MKKLVITTGPTLFQENLHNMVENGLKMNYVCVDTNNKENLDEWVKRADLYLGGGGADVFPATYGSSILKGENMEKFNRKRDLMEIYLIQEFI